VPDVRPTVVCSTRDRNILAIESEVRGAIANGVDSFLVVQGDMLPEVEHWSNSYEIVEYLRALQASIAPATFEVGMSTRSRKWMLRRRIEVGAQFLTTGPVMDPDTVQAVADRLELGPDDPPVYLEITPPFTPAWVKRLESVGAIPVTDELRSRIDRLSDSKARAEGWRAAKEASARAREAGFAGIVLMGLRFETVVGEAFDVWHA
jgi:5,10-methylenetetrahydrofolate reductase